MTDYKITQLTAGTPAASDVIPYVENPASVPVTKKTTISQFAPLTTKGDLYTHDGTTNTRLGVGTNGQALVANSGSAAGLSYHTNRFAMSIPLGDGQTAIGTGIYTSFEVPYSGSITAYHLHSGTVTAGTIQLDVYKSSWNDLPFGTADTICGANYPALSGTNKAYDGTLSGWTKGITQGDWLAVNVNSNGTVIKSAVLSLTGVITDVS